MMTKPIDILRKGVDHWNAWRRVNRDIAIDFSEMDFKGIDLHNVDFSNANLEGTIFNEANLQGADFSHALLGQSELIKANLSKANLFQVDFFVSDLSHAILKDAEIVASNFASAELNHVDLTGSLLSGCTFLGTEVLGTDFSNSELTESIFSHAKMEGCNLSYTKLDSVIFSNVNLENSNFFNTHLGKTTFAFTNLTLCKFMDTVIVSNPCSIDLETLRISPSIPHEFLSRIGFSDSYIEILPNFTMDTGIQLYPVFLSHASANKNFCGLLYDQLSDQGAKVWYDEKKIKPGDIIREEIHKGVSLYDKMILVCSKESLSSWWVEQEIDRYEEKEREYRKQHGEKISLIIPIAVDDEVFTSDNAVAPNLRKRNIADFRNWQDENEYKKAFDLLLEALNVNRGGIEPKSFLKV